MALVTLIAASPVVCSFVAPHSRTFVNWSLQSIRQLLARLRENAATEPLITRTTREQPSAEDNCSICQEAFTHPCQANCGHWFCARCILAVWNHANTVTRPCRCPMCRRDVRVLLPPHERWPVRGDNQLQLDAVNLYNRRFSGLPVSTWQRIRDAPILLRHLFSRLSDPREVVWLLRTGRVIFLAFCFLVLYVLSPFDLIPEGMYGVLGLIDDILVIATGVLYISASYSQTFILPRA